jgi:3-hydroxyacyl-[acyl-carrier-protein] dehydratase
MEQTTLFSLSDILSILPHRPPFLFVDRVVKLIPFKTIVTERDLRSEEPFFAGHFPQKAIMPGVLVTDALAQTSGLLLGLSQLSSKEKPSPEPQIFFLASVTMKFIHPAYPGETLRMTADIGRTFGTLHTFDVEAGVGRNLIAKGSLTLALKGSVS